MTNGDYQDLWERWVGQAADNEGITRAEWPDFINRNMHGSREDIEENVRSMEDHELLQIWYATRDWDPENNGKIVELNAFIREQMVLRALAMAAVEQMKEDLLDAVKDEHGNKKVPYRQAILDWANAHGMHSPAPEIAELPETITVSRLRKQLVS